MGRWRCSRCYNKLMVLGSYLGCVLDFQQATLVEVVCVRGVVDCTGKPTAAPPATVIGQPRMFLTVQLSGG